jgi:hypothetical protein
LHDDDRYYGGPSTGEDERTRSLSIFDSLHHLLVEEWFCGGYFAFVWMSSRES